MEEEEELCGELIESVVGSAHEKRLLQWWEGGGGMSWVAWAYGMHKHNWA